MTVWHVTAKGVAPELLPLCIPGDWVNAWQCADKPDIYFFARRTIGRQGLITKVPKASMPEVAASLTKGSFTILSVAGDTVTLACRAGPEPISPDPI